MSDTARRGADGIARRAPAARDLWQSVPFDCILSALAVFLAAGLKLAGVFP